MTCLRLIRALGRKRFAVDVKSLPSLLLLSLQERFGISSRYAFQGKYTPKRFSSFPRDASAFRQHHQLGLAGLAGYLWGAQTGFVNPELMGFHMSAHAIMMVILGGMGNFAGAIVGAFAFEYLLETYPEVFVIGQGLWSPWYVGNSMTGLDRRHGTGPYYADTGPPPYHGGVRALAFSEAQADAIERMGRTVQADGLPALLASLAGATTGAPPVTAAARPDEIVTGRQ